VLIPNHFWSPEYAEPSLILFYFDMAFDSLCAPQLDTGQRVNGQSWHMLSGIDVRTEHCVQRRQQGSV
jgi:hypothetical protein